MNNRICEVEDLAKNEAMSMKLPNEISFQVTLEDYQKGVPRCSIACPITLGVHRALGQIGLVDFYAVTGASNVALTDKTGGVFWYQLCPRGARFVRDFDYDSGVSGAFPIAMTITRM